MAASASGLELLGDCLSIQVYAWVDELVRILAAFGGYINPTI